MTQTQRLHRSDLDSLASVAVSAARRAGDFIHSWNREGLAVSEKEGGLSHASKVVTEVDLRSQTLILETLAPSIETFDLGLLAEEGADGGDRFSKDFFWCVDPLDGTLPFVEYGTGYSVSIALVSRAGVPHIGVVYDPSCEVLYTAIRGAGTLRNGAPLRVREHSAPSGRLTFFLDRSFTVHPRFDETCRALSAVASEFGCDGLSTVVERGAVLNACGVVETPPACYFKYPKPEPSGGSLWDFAATACIVAEAGGWVSDIFGNPLDLNRADSTFMNHRGVLYASDEQIAERVRAIF